MKEQCLLCVTQTGMHLIGWQPWHHVQHVRISNRKIFFFLSEKKRKKINWDVNIIDRNSLCISWNGIYNTKRQRTMISDPRMKIFKVLVNLHGKWTTIESSRITQAHVTLSFPTKFYVPEISPPLSNVYYENYKKRYNWITLVLSRLLS